MSSEMRELVKEMRAGTPCYVAKIGGGRCVNGAECLRCAERLDWANRLERALLARTEAGADVAVAWQCRLIAIDTGKIVEDWRECSKESFDIDGGNPRDGAYLRTEYRELFTQPQDASGDAESTALYLRPYDVTMIGQAKHAGQDMVSVLAHLHPTEGWDVRFNAAMQAKEAK